MHRFFSSLLIVLIAATATVSAQEIRKVWSPPYDNGIAAKVEGQIITYDELRREMAPLVPQVRQEARTIEEFDQRMGQLYLEILQSLIDRVLIVKEFRNKEYNIPQTVIDNQYDSILIEDFGNDRSRFLEHLQSQGKTPREFRRELEERIIVGAMRGQMRRSQNSISPERIADYYERNKMQFFEEAAVRLRMIVLKPLADESTDVLVQQAETIVDDLELGVPFETLARQFSQDPRANRGGDAGWISRTDMREELTDAAFALEPGDFSDPIVVGSSVFLLKVDDRRPEGIQPIDRVREQIEQILAAQYAREAQERWLERLRGNGYVQYY
jgi:peptidyl-prolyl cis-trans isomerase SurA